jgi:thermostable 8-oxoguanine DNA glycosylase
MVDPENITEFDLCNYELEERILFWICAAGKNGRTAARSLQLLMDATAAIYWGPLASIYRAWLERDLPHLLKFCGIGCYNSKARSFLELYDAVQSGLDLRTCSAYALEQIHGIGMKTSRCFIMHSRYGARYAGLDTHILKYLRAQGIEDVPKSTPSSKKQYLRLEKEFLRMADEQGKLPSVLDLEIWNKYSVKSTKKYLTNKIQ